MDYAENDCKRTVPLQSPDGFTPQPTLSVAHRPHIPAPRLFVLFHPTQATIPRSLTKSKLPLSKIAVNERAVVW